MSHILQQQSTCYHCGEDCNETTILSNDKAFCCEGCKMVYQVLNDNGLCDYYQLNETPGLTQKIRVREGKFSFLENAEIENKLVHFSNGNEKHVTFYLPQVHCSSCIWLLEHLGRLNPGIARSQVNFLKKEVSIVYHRDKTNLKEIAGLLAGIGYEPHISLNDLKGAKPKTYQREKIYKIGVAGFCFGNIMLLSFPEYFSEGIMEETRLKTLFSFLNLGLSLPVFFYCASGFFISAWKSLKKKFLNIDAPIALAILITFARSVYEIMSFSGAGYLDSMSGIVFFMLLGRFFQDKTYESLSFDRDYTSYFPLGVTRIEDSGEEIQIPVSAIKPGDRIKIHSQEIVPVDGILFLGKASIDYSFVTGESLPSEKSIGEIIYAGGKQTAGAIELEAIKEVSQSYLTQLWNNESFNKGAEKKVSFVHAVSRYFTYILFSIALLTGIYWLLNDSDRAWNAVTAILIVACPCALLLSATFTNGSMLTALQRAGLFIKNAITLENLGAADTLVFDKTGTISLQGESGITFSGRNLSEYEEQLLRSLAAQSNHPLSKAIVSFLPVQKKLSVKSYAELRGRGSSALVDGQHIKLGSAEFATGQNNKVLSDGSKVYVSFNDDIAGCFVIRSKYRPALENTVARLRQHYRLALISGDNDSEEYKLREVFGSECDMRFNQMPQDKLDYIKQLQKQGRKVIMIGDGLNDAGALQQSEAGIAVSDDINNFSPGCDAILEGKQFALLPALLDFCKKEKTIIYGSFIISIVYNIIGLSYAVQGRLSPVIAAILMPVSSVSIVLFTTLMSAWYARTLRAH